MDAAVEHEFPSRRGELAFAGRFVGTDPVRIRVRAFPQGGRAGMVSGNTQGDWMRPTLVGTLDGYNQTSRCTYCVSAAPGEVAALVTLVAACLSLVSALILALIGVFGSLVCLVVAAFLVLGFATFVSQTEQGIREERLLLEWLTAVERSLAPPP
jgi:hypothetical protein